MVYQQGKQNLLHNKREKAKKGLTVKTCCVKPFEEDELRFCFSVVSPEKTLYLQAEGDVEKREWMQTLQVALKKMVYNCSSYIA